MGKSEEAKERRLVPEVIEGFFIQASPLAGLSPRTDRKEEHVYRIGRLPRILLPYGEKLEPRFGKLGREYKQIVFDKQLLAVDPTLEWVTPGHPLFERRGRDRPGARVRADQRSGARAPAPRRRAERQGVIARVPRVHDLDALPFHPGSEPLGVRRVAPGTNAAARRKHVHRHDPDPPRFPRQARRYR